MKSKYNKTTKQVEKKPGNTLLYMFALCTVVLCSVQIFLAGRVAIAGDQIKSLETQRAQLVEDISTLKTEVANAGSIATVEEKAVDQLQMIKVGDSLLYIPAATTTSLASHN